MLKLHTKRHVRFATVEKDTVWIVVAVLFETRGTETFAISEPKIVKIIPKADKLALKGSVSKSAFLSLPTFLSNFNEIKHAVISPYVTTFFGSVNSQILIGLAAQPPTR